MEYHGVLFYFTHLEIRGLTDDGEREGAKKRKGCHHDNQSSLLTLNLIP
jgi:hypothetical protein